jgi:hypothetical protein
MGRRYLNGGKFISTYKYETVDTIDKLSSWDNGTSMVACLKCCTIGEKLYMEVVTLMVVDFKEEYGKWFIFWLVNLLVVQLFSTWWNFFWKYCTW